MSQFNLPLTRSSQSATHYASGVLPPLPSLDGVTELGFDTETDRELVLWRKMYGLSYRTPDGREGYVSVRHPETQNYDEDVVRRWITNEFKGKTLVCASAKHEDHVLRTFGVSLEELDVKMYDVFHAAVLLNERRWQTNLEVLAQEEFGEGKDELDPRDGMIHERPAHEIAPYATKDARLALALKERYTPKIEAESLGKVLQLENDLVYSTVEMERNGSNVDVDLLVRYDREVQSEFERRILDIHKRTGLNVDPNSRTDMLRLMRRAGVTHTGWSTEKGNESFTEEALLPWLVENCADCKKHVPCCVDHELVKLGLEARQLSSYRSKYCQAYLRNLHQGRIYYGLHQMRAESEGAMAGTVVGRYSSGTFDRKRTDGGINIQQVVKTKKAPELLKRWPPRRLFIPPQGEVWVSSDASQLQFRELAHYAELIGYPRVAEIYRSDPKADFHNIVTSWTGLNRDFTKNVSYARLFGGGIAKIAFMCHMTEDEAETKVVKPYDRKFPEVNKVMRAVENRAKTKGFVKTVLNRRMRFNVDDEHEKYYSALAKLLQGTEGDLIKLKIRRMYRERRTLGITMRSTVHDEVNKTAPAESVEMVKKFMTIQEFPMKIPITWDTKAGKSWEDAE